MKLPLCLVFAFYSVNRQRNNNEFNLLSHNLPIQSAFRFFSVLFLSHSLLVSLSSKLSVGPINLAIQRVSSKLSSTSFTKTVKGYGK